MRAVLPTLHSGVAKTLTDPADIAAYLIRFMLNNPGRTSDSHELQMLSFRKLVATYQDRMSALAGAIQGELGAALNRFFPNGEYTVAVEPVVLEDALYKITIRVYGPDNQLLLQGNTISIQNGIITMDSAEVTPTET